MTVLCRRIESPLGRLVLVGDGECLTEILFSTGRHARDPDPAWREARDAFVEAAEQLSAYFAGDLHRFDLTLTPKGTPFRQRAWAALREIPFGRVMTYAQLAAAIDKPRAVRAVGAANGANPIPIVIPCHRLLGSNRDLTDFGGGLAAKAALLRLEGHNVEERKGRFRWVDPALP